MTTGIADAGAIDLGGRLGQGILGWGGRIIGGFFGGPAGAAIGGYLGSRAGQWAGKTATAALLDYMESANEGAEELSDEDATTACAECGEIDCFTPPKGMDPNEFRKQLEEQQNALRDMKPQDILDNMAEYARNGRPSGDAAARREARDDYFDRNLESRTRELMDEGYDPSIARGMAEDGLFEEMADLDATHVVDLIAGGDGAISGLGNRSANRSIGSQWRHRFPGSDKTRAQQLKDYAEQAKAEGKDMSGLELKICGENGGTPEGQTGGQAPNSGSPGTGGPSTGNTPMS